MTSRWSQEGLAENTRLGFFLLRKMQCGWILIICYWTLSIQFEAPVPDQRGQPTIVVSEGQGTLKFCMI